MIELPGVFQTSSGRAGAQHSHRGPQLQRTSLLQTSGLGLRMGLVLQLPRVQPCTTALKLHSPPWLMAVMMVIEFINVLVFTACCMGRELLNKT